MTIQAHARDTVCVFSEGASLADIRLTIDSIARNSVLCSRIFLIVSEAGDPDVRGVAIADGLRPVALDFVAEGDPVRAMGMSLPADGRGVFVVNPGVSVPFAWDARLARVADDCPDIGTVSPVSATAPGFALFGPAMAGHVLVEDMPRIDRLLFSLSNKSYFGVPAFFESCFLITQNALRVLSHQGDGSPDRNAWAHILADQGYLHVITDSLYVHDVPALAESKRHDGQTERNYFSEPTRTAVNEAFFGGVDFRNAPGLDDRPVQLHVVHNHGGGIEQWVKDYCAADGERINLILRPYSKGRNYGEGLALYSDVLDSKPLRIWDFPVPIYATTASHLEYRQVLKEILREYCVDAILVSSLIGHSLDVLDTGRPTIFISHDYFPYCPAINLYYQGICSYCDAERLADCARNNRLNEIFPEFSGAARLLVRERLLALLAAGNVSIVAPTRSVRDNLVRLEPRFGNLRFEIVAHGHASDFHPSLPGNNAAHGRLRVLMLGLLSASKGVELLRGVIDEIDSFADVFLLGCGEVGEYFRGRENVHIVSRYEVNELPGLVADIAPDLGLLLSIWPETFSYTLSELMQLGIPVLATNVGGFADRIEPDVTGFLAEPDAALLKTKLRLLNENRDAILRVRSNLRALTPKTPGEMVGEYHRLLPLPSADYARYPLRQGFQELTDISHGSRDQHVLSQQLLLSGMWKEINRLNLMLGLKEDILHRSESRHFRIQQALEEKGRQQQAEKDRQLAEKDRLLEEKDRQRVEMDKIIQARDAQLSEIYASTSWKVSGPVRWAGFKLRKLRILMRCLKPIISDPRKAPSILMHLFGIWRSFGMLALKQSLLRLPMTGLNDDAWEKYRQEFSLKIKPGILSRIHEMTSPPLISILMPTYNTPKHMLRETIQSVLGQLYPNWELCIADDGSTQPHVRKVLQKYADEDSRIRLYLGEENKGVSHASNMALSLASGEFVVLLDHDDVLEEQAIFRVAECVRAEQPDMLYSDEVLISGDGLEVLGYVFRPAFSPELLRSHPYIVHMVGFRTQLLREIGGFDESLSISQDYDLILRLSEKADRIVHLPEILYRWRVYGDSAGHQKKLQVMTASKNVLARHLERCGEKGRIADGPSFNFFDARYSLEGDFRVAIIIPTRNHGDLVRQCIDSIERTVRDIPFDIVLIDHASDDAESLEYFETLKTRIQVLRYEGPFNFSTINNWAISRLTGQYSHYLLCNNDIEAIEPGWLERMMELGQKPSVGIVGAMLYYPDRRTVQHAGVCVGAYGAAEHYGKFMRMPYEVIEPGYLGGLTTNHEVSAVTAACLLIKKEAFDEVDGFDEKLVVGFGDVDLCLKVGAKGYRVLFCPYAELVHHESFTRGKSTGDPHPEDSAYFQRKWRGLLEAGDPYYNPNLSTESTGWHVKFPITHDLELRRRLYKTDHARSRQEIAYFRSGVQ